MSVEAISAVLSMWMERSSTKFVLVAMANCADQNMVCWPSMAYLCQATCQDRKTVLENIKRLKAAGLISDTEQRKGRTAQVAVYRLNVTENGTVKASHKRNGSENGMVPKTDAKGPVFPRKESQKRDTEPSLNPKETSGIRKSTIPACPHDAIRDLYHDALTELPKARLMGADRKKVIGEFWKWIFTEKKSDGTPRAENGEQALEWVCDYFTRARDNDFIMGRTARSAEHANWKADIDFLVSPKGRKQVIEKTGGAA